MTELQIYLIVAPLVLLLVGASAAYWWVHRPEEGDRRTR
jgi:hypothetical protein